MAQTLQCEQRDLNTTGYLKELKRQGWVPGVIYGKETGNVNIILSGRELERTLNRHGYRGLFTLQVKGLKKTYPVLIKEYQKNPISGKLIHLDFMMVQVNEKLASDVTIQWLGEEEIAKSGNLVQVVGRSVEISCLPTAIPDTIQVDIANLGIGDKITAGDIALPEGVELVTEAETVLLTILAPSKAAAEQADASLEEGEVGDAAE